MATLGSIASEVHNRIQGAPLAWLESKVLEVHREIVARIPDLRISATFEEISLVNGTREYDVPAAYVHIADVYVKSGTTYTRLTPDGFYSKRQEGGTTTPWLTAPSKAIGSIKTYVVACIATSTSAHKRRIILDGSPTGISGHKLCIVGSKVEDTVSTSTSTSEMLATTDIYIETLSYRAALEFRPEVAQVYLMSKEAAFQSAVAMIKTFVQDLSTSDAVRSSNRIQ